MALKWHQEFGELSLEHRKVIDEVFLSKAHTVSEELCVMTLKGVTKFKGKLTCELKNDIRNLVNFHASS